jgi:hypothetical protein
MIIVGWRVREGGRMLSACADCRSSVWRYVRSSPSVFSRGASLTAESMR